jgi:hypothetical protein
LEGPWSSYNASLGRPLLNSAKFLQNEAAASAAKTDAAEPAELTSEKEAEKEVLSLFAETKE